MPNLFTAHPHTVSETYPEHFKVAFYIGVKMLIAGFACIIHAIFPFWFERTGSKAIFSLADFITKRREQAASKNGI